MSAGTDGAGPGRPDGVDRVAVVTGGGSGIGLAVSRRLAAAGDPVAVVDRDGATAEAAATAIAEAGGTAVGLTADVTDRAAVEAAVAEVVDRFGPPTILVTSAGLQQFGPFLKVDLDTWRHVLDVNLTGTFHCCQVVVPHMLAAGWGRIVTISSSSAQGGQPYMAAYVSSKAAVIGLTKSLALELGPKGVTVNTIPPGFVDTPMLRDTEEKGLLGGSVATHEERTPVRRVGRPDDIANACAFLVGDDADYVTGQVIGVNGGRNT